MIVDDQPQVSKLSEGILDSNDGFQEVTRRKGGKTKSPSDETNGGSCGSPSPSPSGELFSSPASAPAATTASVVSTTTGSGSGSAAMNNSSKKAKDKKRSKGTGYDRNRQNKLPPRFAKQRENNRMNAIKSSGNSSPVDNSSVIPFSVKDTSSMPPAKNAWDKPLTAALRDNSPQTTQIAEGNVQLINKPNSFENHDSGVEINDQPNSIGSSQRSSPGDPPVSTNFPKVDKSALDGTSVPSQTIIFENSQFKAAGTVNATVGAEYKAKFGSVDQPKPQRQRETRDRKISSPDSVSIGAKDHQDGSDKSQPIELPLSFNKADENGSDMKLDFTFDSDLAADLSNEKVVNKTMNLPNSLIASNSIHSPISPSTDDLNQKIASVKKVWDRPTMATVPEHVEDVSHSAAFSSASFSSAEAVSASLDHAPALESFASTKVEQNNAPEDPGQEVYQGPSLQQGAVAAMSASMVYTTSAAAASLAKSEAIRSSGNVCKVKPQQQAAASSSPGPSTLGISSLSPPLVSTGHNSTSMYLSNTPAFGGMSGAIPSPPTVMFNSSQQLQPQTGLYQPFLDGTPVLGQRGASQFSQYPPYGLGQSLGSNAFGQQSMFLQTPPPLTTPADLYNNSISQYRLQPTGVTGFGQNQPQNQNTVLISSASNTLMSSAVKPSSQTFGNSQQNFGTIGSKAGTPFQQSGLGTALQGTPQPSLYIYDPSQPVGLIGSQLVQQRPAVQSSVIQAIQTPNSYYSNNGGGAPGAPPTAPPTGGPQQAAAAAGFYTASGSPLQAAVQQQAQPPLPTPPAPFGLQGFGNQSQPPTAVGVQNFGSGMSITAQQLSAQAFRGSHAGIQASFLKSLQPGTNVPDVTRQQIKSPSSAQNAFASSYFPSPTG